MNISTDYLNDTALVRVTGRVDHSNARDFETELENLQHNFFNESGKHLLVDFTGLEFITSAGLRGLLFAAKTLKAQSGSMVIVNPNSTVLEVLKISRFDLLFPIMENIEEALKEISPTAYETHISQQQQI
jgi:anti-anti-sigma factor